jgi:hypothetical protein
VEHRDGVTPREVRDGATEGRLDRRALLDVRRDEVGNDLGVGLALEGVARRFQALPERVVVLDDPAVDDGELPLAVGVGVGVRVAGAPWVLQRVLSVGPAVTWTSPPGT